MSAAGTKNTIGTSTTTTRWMLRLPIRPRPVDQPAIARCCCSFGHSHGSGFASPPFPGSYLAAVTDFTEMVSPLAVPVTLACSQASLLRLSSAA
jgi:hypothetical protein